jgi:hypothetical protein
VMNHTTAVLALAGAVVGIASIGVAQAARTDVVPVHGTGACKTSPPQLLRPGRAPLAPLRFDLTGISHHSQKVVEVERFVTRAKLLDGKWHSGTTIRRIDEAITGGEISNAGQVALVDRNRVSFPGTKTSPAGKGGTFTVRGHTDAVSGGLFGGSVGNDRFPTKPVGVGASWRVVNCDAVDDDVPAQETRTYTVRSIRQGLLVVTSHDVITMDPKHRDVGSQKVGGVVVRFRLDSVHGTASSTYRVRLDHALAGSSTLVTRVQFTFHAIAKNVPPTHLVTRVVDTRKDDPAG